MDPTSLQVSAIDPKHCESYSPVMENWQASPFPQPLLDLHSELVRPAVTYPHTATIPLLFCVVPNRTYCLQSLPPHYGEEKDYSFDSCQVDRLVKSYGLLNSTTQTRRMRSQIFSTETSGVIALGVASKFNRWQQSLLGPTRPPLSYPWGWLFEAISRIDNTHFS